MLKCIKKNVTSIPSGVFAISFANFLVNISTALVFGLSTCYMKQCLNMSTGNVAFLQNFVDGIGFFARSFSGVLSDFIRRRKIIVIIGFSCIVIAKPILALAATPFLVFLARIMDRMGNGIQAVPRDALIGDLADKTNRGQCFGMKNSLATFGSFMGAIVGYGLMRLTNDNYALIFFFGAIPCFLAIFIFGFGTSDPLHEQTKIKPSQKYTFMLASQYLGRDFWKLMLVVLFFTFSCFGESTLVLNAMDRHDIAPANANLIVVMYNATYSLISYPIGFLSDKIGRKILLLIGFVIMMLAQLALALSWSLWMMYVGVLLWGLQKGITTSLGYVLVNDYVPLNELRGTALSIMTLLQATATILAGGVFRHLSTDYTIQIAFFFGLAMSATALILGWALIKERYQNEKSAQPGIVRSL